MIHISIGCLSVFDRVQSSVVFVFKSMPFFANSSCVGFIAQPHNWG
ncbi:hypothetical protein SLEP1_g22666 [Rubroshorea leprosula]|uniref:Uncharacterized protein n=1 Tax=Rubroshorea leprosula TaxID=152421 RepID=A0AAV5JH73_9ROSI|nr:hypothetical protein SLEP1_g22666 [Rubroshorea leprosula]